MIYVGLLKKRGRLRTFLVNNLVRMGKGKMMGIDFNGIKPGRA
jgi:hypothetical protein